MPDVPFHLDLPLRSPKQQPIKQNISQNIQEINPSLNINLDFEENSPFQEGIMPETFQRLDKPTKHKIVENILYLPLILEYLTWNKRK